MKKILTVIFAGAMLVACGSSNKSTTGTASTMPQPATNGTTNGTTGNPTGDQEGGGSSIGTGMGNMSGSSTGPTGSGGSNSEQQDSQASSPTH